MSLTNHRRPPSRSSRGRGVRAGITLVLILVAAALGCSGRDASPAGPSQPEITVESVSPPSGPDSGGTVVSVSGGGFEPGAMVTFGGAAAAHVAVVDSTAITATTPALLPGTPTQLDGRVDVVVRNPDGRIGVLVARFRYYPSRSPEPGCCPWDY
jgi:hypothetical protein